MKKKIISLALVVAMVAIMLTSFTLAYFTDTDYADNTMISGNIDIVQLEKERVVDDEGTVSLGDFTPKKTMYPSAYPADNGVAWGGPEYSWGDYIANAAGANQMFVDEANAIDKLVFVRNAGENDVYFRTLIFVETHGDKDIIALNANRFHYDWDPTTTGLQAADNGKSFTIDDNGQKYDVFVATYDLKLAKGEVSRPSLMQAALYNNVVQEDMVPYGETIDIRVVSQAAQTEGFENADAALNAAFGEYNAENALKWFREAA